MMTNYFRKLTSPYSTTKMSTVIDSIQSANSGLKEVTSIAVINGDSILWGKRNEDYLWCLPGGGVLGNETPHQGAARELFEETGLKVNELIYLGHKLAKTGIIVHSFRFDVHEDPGVVQTMTTRFDPDHEFSEVKWVHLNSREWNEILASSREPRNITLEFLGLM